MREFAMAATDETTTPSATQLTELFIRSGANPLLTADDWPYPITAVSNPSAAIVDGETLLLCRSQDQ